MLWHRQAIFESKGDKLSSSVECRIRTHQGLKHQIASRLNARWQTDSIYIYMKVNQYLYIYILVYKLVYIHSFSLSLTLTLTLTLALTHTLPPSFLAGCTLHPFLWEILVSIIIQLNKHWSGVLRGLCQSESKHQQKLGFPDVVVPVTTQWLNWLTFIDGFLIEVKCIKFTRKIFCNSPTTR